MNIQQHIWVGLSLFALIIFSTGAQAKTKIRTCADLKTDTILKKARPYKSTIEKYARLNGLDVDFVLSIAAVETCFNSRAVSPVGAKGLMQLMPATAKRFGVRSRINARQNVRGGTKYLKFLMKRYKHNMKHAAAAYNAGEGRVDRYKGIPPYRETRRYVKNVLRVYNKLTKHRKSNKRSKKSNKALKLNKVTLPLPEKINKPMLLADLKPKQYSEGQAFKTAVRVLLK